MIPEVTIIHHQNGRVYGKAPPANIVLGVPARDALKYLRQRNCRVDTCRLRPNAAGATIFIGPSDDSRAYFNLERFSDMARQHDIVLPRLFVNLMAFDVTTITRSGIAIVSLNSTRLPKYNYALVKTGGTEFAKLMMFLIEEGYAPKYEVWRETGQYSFVADRVRNKNRNAKSLKMGCVKAMKVDSLDKLIESLDEALQELYSDFQSQCVPNSPVIMAGRKRSFIEAESSDLAESSSDDEIVGKDVSESATSCVNINDVTNNIATDSDDDEFIADEPLDDSSDESTNGDDEDKDRLLQESASLIRRLETAIKRSRR